MYEYVKAIDNFEKKKLILLHFIFPVFWLFHTGPRLRDVIRLESSCLAFNALYERLTYIVNLIRAAQLNSCVM